MATEMKIMEGDKSGEMASLNLGELSSLTCPECHGTLTRIEEGTLTRYRCHTGHGFSTKALLSGIQESVEDSVWNAIRALGETIMLLEQTAKDLEKGSITLDDYQHQINQAQAQLATLRPLVTDR